MTITAECQIILWELNLSHVIKHVKFKKCDIECVILDITVYSLS